MGQISKTILRDFEDRLEEAVNAVRLGTSAKAVVSLAYTVQTDEDGEMEGTFTLKGASAKKGTWQPSVSPRLALDEDEAA